MVIVRFRVPFWYKFIMVLLWVVSFDLTIFLFYKPLHLILRIFFLILDIIFGVWVISLFKKEMVIDLEQNKLILRRELFDLFSIERYGMSIVFYLSDGTRRVFSHPVEDFELLKKLINEKGSGWFEAR
jgi:phosphoglycerol transferase MdoB-like AlkP superfamily enzyme